MSEERATPFSKTQATAPSAPSMPPAYQPSNDPSDAPKRILLNWAILIAVICGLLAVGGTIL